MISHITVSERILSWYYNFSVQNLPWKLNKTIYTVWISEIMLQQTQVNTVIPYYNKFIEKFPTITKLAIASLNEVLFMWSGLGYYARAKNIHKTAKIIVNNYDSKFPINFNTLITFPGIGKTTAGAILSLALNQHYPILDGNVKRILIRYYALNYHCTNISTTNNNKLWTLIKQLLPSKLEMIAAFNQAIMDLGRLICTNKHPQCSICPIRSTCQAFLTHEVHKYPVKRIQLKPSAKTIWLLVLLYNNNTIWLERRRSQKIWNELFCFPEFSDFNILNVWLSKYNMSHYKYETMTVIKHKISNINLEIKPILLNIDKQLCYTTSGIWYNLVNPAIIGLPKPVSMILKKL